MPASREVQRESGTSETATLEGRVSVNSDMLKALTDENDGMMRAGQLPEVGRSFFFLAWPNVQSCWEQNLGTLVRW